MKNENYHIVWIITKLIRNIVETEAKLICLTHIYMVITYLLGTGISVWSGGL
jgi:nicotinamide riboside transporter PnuC